MMTSDIYPATLRLSLEASRAQGVPFNDAWEAALRESPPKKHDPYYDPRGDQGGEGLLRQTRDWMEAGYKRLTLPGPHYGALEAALIEAVSEGGSRRPLREDRVASYAPPGRCRWGGPHCTEDAVKGERFCKEHLAELHGMRETRSAWGQKRHAP